MLPMRRCQLSTFLYCSSSLLRSSSHCPSRTRSLAPSLVSRLVMMSAAISSSSTTSTMASSSFSSMHQQSQHQDHQQPVHKSSQQQQPSSSQEQPQAAPLLLLECDEFFVTHDGISRTYYELKGSSASTTLGLEEEYNLKTAKKTFVLRSKDMMNTNVHQEETSQQVLTAKRAQGVVRLGRPLDKIELQEIDQGVFGSAGTGATTWESSIAMALLHHHSSCHRPATLLKGNVLELGSGVGLGGILLMQQQQQQQQQIPHNPQSGSNNNNGNAETAAMTSLTLTDGNEEVLRECRLNWHRHCSSHQRHDHHNSPSLYIKHLDWHSPSPPAKDEDRYDTILASDCAYKHTDIVALAVTMKVMLRPGGSIHIFGPYNRGALQQLLVELKCQEMDAEVNGLEMNRYRLQSANDNLNDESIFCSRNVVRFLHITAKHKTTDDSHDKRDDHFIGKDTTLQDID